MKRRFLNADAPIIPYSDRKKERLSHAALPLATKVSIQRAACAGRTVDEISADLDVPADVVRGLVFSAEEDVTQKRRPERQTRANTNYAQRKQRLGDGIRGRQFGAGSRLK
jgi:hypothetical protein